MSEDIARQWLTDVATTANKKNFAAHMDLISQRVCLQCPL